jgi:hypothetical protein
MRPGSVFLAGGLDGDADKSRDWNNLRKDVAVSLSTLLHGFCLDVDPVVFFGVLTKH